MEFDVKCSPLEDLFIWYFYKGLKPSIKLLINKKGQKLDGWKELIRKATKAKAKAKIQLASSRNMDQRYYHENWPVYASLDKTIKDFKSKTPSQIPRNLGPKTTPWVSIKVGMPRPPIKLEKRKKNTRDKRSRRKILMLVLLVP